MSLNLPILNRFNDPRQRKLVILIFVFSITAIVLLVGSQFIGKSSIGLRLNQLVAAQQEALRINKLADGHGPDSAMRRLQADINILISSDIALLEPQRKSLSGENNIPAQVVQAATVFDAEERLETAAGRNRLESEYVSVIEEQLTKIRQLAETARSVTRLNELKFNLDRVIENTDSLLEEVRNQ